ncbi:MAG: hypothetical protein R3B60_05335, partial [Candidatus Paceibacterota bacterium]
TLSWLIGDIAPKETVEFTVKASINDINTEQNTPLPLSSNVYSDQPDANESDNKDTILLHVREWSNSNNTPKKTFPAKFEIEKTADKEYAIQGDTVNYTVTLRNRGGQLYNALLTDVLRDTTGNILAEQTWPLDTIKNGETITITYSIVIPSGIKDGVYTNTAQVVGAHESTNVKYQNAYMSPLAEHELVVGQIEDLPLIGLTEETSICSPYLTTYLKQNKVNDTEEVIKLQQFLREYTDERVMISGIFDNTTKLAVDKFQQEYRSEILEPWGMTKSSGYVYYTTQKKINEIMCDNKIDFPLTDLQKNEMDLFKFKQGQVVPLDPDINSELYGTILPAQDLAEEINTPKPVAIKSTTSSFLKDDYRMIYDRLDNWLFLLENK